VALAGGDLAIRDRHLRPIEPLVFVLSFVNTKCNYTQGFHELAGPLYSMVLAGASAISDDETEAIAFFLLFNLLIGTNLSTVF
jgi:hypothetical protein